MERETAMIQKENNHENTKENEGSPRASTILAGRSECRATVDRLELEHYLIAYHQINTGTTNHYSLEPDIHRKFRLVRNASMGQGYSHSLMVERLEKTGPKLPMNRQ